MNTLIVFMDQIGPYLALFFMYMILFTPVFLILLQTQTMTAIDIFSSLRNIFDAIMGVYYSYWITEG